MVNSFTKLRRMQIQDNVDQFIELAKKPVPKRGWVRVIRDALGLTSHQLAKRVGVSQVNISKIEKSEVEGTISLNTLAKVAAGLHCKVVYCLVPLKPLDQILEDRARQIAHERIQAVNYSMGLEHQELTSKQIKQQEEILMQELLQDNPKRLWRDDDI